MPACVDSRSCMVRALLAAISSAVITETATGRVAASENALRRDDDGAEFGGGGVCWAAARAGANKQDAGAAASFHLHDLEATRDPAAIHDGRTPRPADRERGVLTVERGRYRLPCSWRMGTVAGAAQAGLGRRGRWTAGGDAFLFPVYLSRAAGKCCVLAGNVRRKHRFGAETVSPPGAEALFCYDYRLISRRFPLFATRPGLSRVLSPSAPIRPGFTRGGGAGLLGQRILILDGAMGTMIQR